jgi:hypothetical protein
MTVEVKAVDFEYPGECPELADVRSSRKRRGPTAYEDRDGEYEDYQAAIESAMLFEELTAP